MSAPNPLPLLQQAWTRRRKQSIFAGADLTKTSNTHTHTHTSVCPGQRLYWRRHVFRTKYSIHSSVYRVSPGATYTRTAETVYDESPGETLECVAPQATPHLPTY